MAKKTKAIILLFVSIFMAVSSFVLMIVATIGSFKYGKLDYSHDIIINDIVPDQEEIDGVLYYNVSFDGGIQNNTENEFKYLSVEIMLVGINNKTGEQTEYATCFVIDKLEASSKSDFSKQILKVGNRSGYIPQSVKEVRILINGEMTPIQYERANDANLIMFAVALGLMFIAGVVFAKWFCEQKKMKKQDDLNKFE